MRNWIQAARLRTLPLSLSGIIMGSGYAYYQGFSNWYVLILSLLTTLGLQILSNFANDYGDGVKGTDANRIGEKRMVASGIISPSQMKKAVIFTAIVTFFIALLLIFVAFGKENFMFSLFFILLGISAIVAAIKYTVGKNAYGYSGFGDFFVFIFFGFVSVIGSNFLYTQQLNGVLFLAATTIGLLSVAVLNLNNMRDIENDKTANKITLVVKLGLKNAKMYHQILLVLAVLSYLAFSYFSGTSFFPILIVFFVLFLHLKTIYNAKKYEDFDPELKKIALSTFALSLLFWVFLFLKF